MFSRHRQVREQRVVLEHHADAALFRGEGEARPGNDLAGQFDAAGMHRLETGDGAQGGGLAAARRPEQATDVAGVEVQVEVLHHRLVAVAAGQVAQVEQQVVGFIGVPGSGAVGVFDEEFQQRLLGVQAVLGLVPGD